MRNKGDLQVKFLFYIQKNHDILFIFINFTLHFFTLKKKKLIIVIKSWR